MQSFFDSVVALIIKTSTDLPPDVRAAMRHAVETEEASSRAGQALNIISQNIDQAADIEGAICQDTGMPTFEVKTPVGAGGNGLIGPDGTAGGGAGTAGEIGRASCRERV